MLEPWQTDEWLQRYFDSSVLSQRQLWRRTANPRAGFCLSSFDCQVALLVYYQNQSKHLAWILLGGLLQIFESDKLRLTPKWPTPKTVIWSWQHIANASRGCWQPRGHITQAVDVACLCKTFQASTRHTQGVATQNADPHITVRVLKYRCDYKLQCLHLIHHAHEVVYITACRQHGKGSLRQ